LAWRVSIEEIIARGFSLNFKNPHEVTQAKDCPEDLSTLLKLSEERVARLRQKLAQEFEKALLT
jgi:type I restriction enzyme M protein